MKLILALAWMMLVISCVTAPDKDTIVALQPYGHFSVQQTEQIEQAIQDVYGVQVQRLPQQPHSQSSFINLKSPRYRADRIIEEQRSQRPSNADYILGLTHQDISTTKKENGKVKSPASTYEDWGIMGLAYCPGNSAVISTFRLQYPKQEVYFSRIKKVAVHELGHNFGLPHCPDKSCVMTDAVERVSTIDHAQLALCVSCADKVFSRSRSLGKAEYSPEKSGFSRGK